LAINGASNVTVLPYAISDSKGLAWLDSHRLGSSYSAVTQSRGGVEVQTTTVRAFCDEYKVHPSVIKIDVEGGEYKVLAGAIEEFEKTRAIILEFHEQELREAGVDPSAFSQSLLNLGKRTIVLPNQTPQKGLRAGTELGSEGSVTGNVHLALTEDNREQ
jgi:methyltransferase FkbM-like protein